MALRREILSYIGVGTIGGAIGYYSGARELLGIQSEEAVRSPVRNTPTEDTPTDTDSPETAPPEPTETPTEEPNTPTESAENTDTIESGFSDEFDYSDSPENYGWNQINNDGNATTSDSRLTAASGQPILVRPQEIASGEFTFRGLQNTERYFGLKIDFIGKDDEWGNPGYRIRIAQVRPETESHPGWNDVQLARLDDDGRELLETVVDQHNGNPFDLTVSREDETGQFNIVFDDGDRQVETTVGDSTYSSSSYFRVQFGGEDQYIDSIDIS